MAELTATPERTPLETRGLLAPYRETMSDSSGRRALSTFVGLALLCGGVASAASVTDRVERSLALPERGAVEIENANGDVVLEVIAGSDVRIVADREARAGSRERATDLLGRLQLHAARGGDVVRVTVPEHRPESWLSWRKEEWVRADLRVGVPLAARVHLQSRNGDVSILSSGRATVVKTVNGDILIREVRGERLEASSVNGDIAVRILQLAAGSSLDLSSVNGDVKVVVPQSLHAAIDARTVNGCVGSNVELADSRKTRSQLVGLANGGGGQIRVRTTNGQVWVKGD